MRRAFRVGKFSLDIIGREVATGSAVVIENQYGPTDHGHLGQILTYAGGTKPTTVVWVAEEFREEHRAALEWLNTHTDPSIRFFGVRLAAVTLDGAPGGLIAPFLELVVSPMSGKKWQWPRPQQGRPAARPPARSSTGSSGRNLRPWLSSEAGRMLRLPPRTGGTCPPA